MAKISINLKDGTVEKETPSSTIVGIDLGTTNSLMAYIREGVPATVDYNDGMNVLVPSIVHFTPDGQIIVGDKAKTMLVKDPNRTIYSVKRLLGRSYSDLSEVQAHLGYKVFDESEDRLVKIQVGDQFYTPIELSAEILKELKRIGETKLGHTIHQVVITVPAYFNDSQRQATRDAGKLAGLDVLRIINEPTAASLAYDIGTQKGTAEKVVVYDLGGGTFDISILDIQDGVFEVLATNGDTFLGGDDFDKAIIDYWIDEYQIDKDRLQTDKSFGQYLRITAEEAKKHLTSNVTYSADAEYGTFSIDLSTFQELIDPLVKRTIELCSQCLSDSGLEKSNISQVILVGGSTRTPYIKAKVKEYFQVPINDTIDPDKVVAMGAAVQGDILAGNRKDMLLLDITPLSLGIETIGGLMDVIVPRNTKVPAGVARQYTTSVDGQKNLRVSVYQGERDLVEDNRKLGEFILSNIPPMSAGIPKIEIRFLLDADGILRVKAKELRSAVETEVEIRSQYGLSEEEMGLMLKNSIVNAELDRQKRALIESKTEANNVLLHTRKFLVQNDSILTEEEKREIHQHLAILAAAINSDDKNLIEQKMQEFNDVTRPIAERTMDINIADALKDKSV